MKGSVARRIRKNVFGEYVFRNPYRYHINSRGQWINPARLAYRNAKRDYLKGIFVERLSSGRRQTKEMDLYSLPRRSLKERAKGAPPLKRTVTFLQGLKGFLKGR
jgi:hypothetical protein